jgi:hypothetical protein
MAIQLARSTQSVPVKMVKVKFNYKIGETVTFKLWKTRHYGMILAREQNWHGGLKVYKVQVDKYRSHYVYESEIRRTKRRPKYIVKITEIQFESLGEGLHIFPNRWINLNKSASKFGSLIRRAIPLRPTLDDIKLPPRVPEPRIGIPYSNIEDMDKNAGVLVMAVSLEGPAWKGGLREWDIIVKMGSQIVHNRAEYTIALRHMYIGQAMEVTVIRDKQPVQLVIVIEGF